MRKAYQTDLSDVEWSCLESHLPAPEANGRPRVYPLREILDAFVSHAPSAKARHDGAVRTP